MEPESPENFPQVDSKPIKRRSKKKSKSHSKDPELGLLEEDYDEYEQTLKDWKEKTSQVSFTYDFILEKYQNKLNKYSLIVFFISSLTTLFSIGNLGISESSNFYLYWTIQILNVVAALITNFCAAKIKIMGWQPIVTNSQKYLDAVENFLALIMSETILPPKHRTEPEKFIVNNKDKFLTILASAPDVPRSDLDEGSRVYQDSKEKFKNNLLII